MHPTFSKYLVTIVIIGLATLTQYLLWPWIEPASYLLFFPAVLLSSFYGNGNLAIFLTVLITQYFFIAPTHSFKMHWPDDYMRGFLFLISVIMIRNATHRLRSAKIAAEETAKTLNQERTARENFVATLTHDLQTPLTATKLNLQMLMRKLNEPEYIMSSANKALVTVNRIEMMIRDLLDANKIKSGKPLPLVMAECDLGDILSSTINDLSTIYGTRFVIKLNDKVQGRWSCDGLRRIIENLCSNAVKYGDPTAPITISFEKKEPFGCLTVHNMGNPIPKEKQAKVFDAFMQSDSSTGWGLGLTLVKGLTEAHGGKVEVESDQQSGTAFKVWLPLHMQSMGPDASHNEESSGQYERYNFHESPREEKGNQI